MLGLVPLLRARRPRWDGVRAPGGGAREASLGESTGPPAPREGGAASREKAGRNGGGGAWGDGQGSHHSPPSKSAAWSARTYSWSSSIPSHASPLQTPRENSTRGPGLVRRRSPGKPHRRTALSHSREPTSPPPLCVERECWDAVTQEAKIPPSPSFPIKKTSPTLVPDRPTPAKREGNSLPPPPHCPPPPPCPDIACGITNARAVPVVPGAPAAP